MVAGRASGVVLLLLVEERGGSLELAAGIDRRPRISRLGQPLEGEAQMKE